jgi:hypothetical protein
VLLSTPLHASSNFTVSVQLANKRGFTKNKKKYYPDNIVIKLAAKHENNRRLWKALEKLCAYQILSVTVVFVALFFKV